MHFKFRFDRTLLSVGVAALFLGGSPPVHASGVVSGSSGLWVTYEVPEAEGTANRVVVSLSNNVVEVRDTGVSVLDFETTSESPCARGSDLQTVVCQLHSEPETFGLQAVVVNTGGGSDRLQLGDGLGSREIYVEAYGGGGSDVFVGSSAPAVYYGDAGNDLITGGSGGEHLFGGSGDDVIAAGSGADYASGDSGIDRFSYADGRSQMVYANLAGTPSGNASDITEGRWGDQLREFERLTGTTSGNDILVGSGGDDALAGLGGANDVIGLDGADTLTVSGGPSRLVGGAGNDQFGARNAVADRVTCGSGSDIGIVDIADIFSADCESLMPG